MSSIPATQRLIKLEEDRSTVSDSASVAPSSKRDGNTVREVKTPQLASATNATVEAPNFNIALPNMLVPQCSRCGRKSESVRGAIFIGVTGKTKKQVGAGPLLLWQCSYCKKYEVTSATPTCLFKRLLGVRRGGDFEVTVDRRPTYNSHGKLTLSRKRFFGLIQPQWFICYVPVRTLSKS